MASPGYFSDNHSREVNDLRLLLRSYGPSTAAVAVQAVRMVR